MSEPIHLSSEHSITRPLPALRAAIDVTPVQLNGERLFCIRDRQDPDAPQIVVSQAALLLASLLDGQRSLDELQTAFALRTGARLPRAEIVSFVERLDDTNLLASERYKHHAERQREAFRSAAERAAIHAGGAYPGTLDELRPFLERLYTCSDGPGAPPGAVNGTFARALIAPHIDLHRGGPTYAWTYKALAECQPAELYVLLGTCHTPMDTPLAATRKAYATPFGPALADRDFLELLESHYPGDLYADEYSHRAEHSLEFQALYLRYLGLTGDNGATVVPLLCGSLHQWVDTSASPRTVQQIDDAIAALGRALAEYGKRYCLLAGADLAHVGPQFGDPDPVTARVLERVGRGDAEMLEVICRGDAEGFYRQVMADLDARRICGLAPIYYLLALVGPAAGRVVRYAQWADPAGQGSVTYAGVIFEETAS